MIDRLYSVSCERCDGHTEVDPGERPAAGERFWCAECGQDLGDWVEVQAASNAMLSEALGRI